MKDLQDLVQIVTRPKLKSVHLLDTEVTDSSSKLSEFYHHLVEGSFESDDEAAYHFYQKEKSCPAYQKLRTTIKDRLVKSLFLIDLKKASYAVRQKAYYESYSEWAAAKILFGKQASTVAISLSQKLLKLAKKFEFTELAVDITHTLRLYYGTIEGDYKKYQKYNEMFKYYEQLWILENRAEEYYTDLSIRFVNSKASDVDVQKIAWEHFQELAPYLEKYNSYQLHFCTYLIKVGIYTLTNNHEKIIEACESAILFFRGKSYSARLPFQAFYYKQAISYFQVRNFDACIEAAEKCESFIEKGSFNWFKVREVYLLVKLHKKNAEIPHEILETVLSNDKFDNLPANVQEFWKILEAYLQFVKFCQEDQGSDGQSFRIAKFLNEIEVFAKDKKGMNISVQVLKILVNLLKRNHDDLIESMDAINQYRKRYLQKEDTQRSNLFFKMLLVIPRKGFQRNEVEKAAQKYIDELDRVPLKVMNQTYQLEIVPYEKLWALALDLI
ncbi:MAG: hypothetical protein AB8B61_04785 [Cyclobacteriaceae bacterium]